MSFRITGTMIFNNLMSNMRQSSKLMGDLQEQLVSMRRINRPSDDPIGASQAQSLKSSENDYKQYDDNIDQGRSMLDFTASVLETMSSEVVNARSKLLSAINPTADATSREVTATELNDMLKSIMVEANSSFGGIYVVGGTQTGSPPFEIARGGAQGVESVAFNGDSGRIRYVVGATDLVDVNENPTEVFMPRGEANGLFNTLIEIRTLMQNPDGLSDGQLSQKLSEKVKSLDDVHDDIVRALGRVGTRSKALQIRRDLYAQAEISSAQRRSEIEDADIADVVLRLKNQQTIFQVIIQSSTSVYNSNLTDFLK